MFLAFGPTDLYKVGPGPPNKPQNNGNAQTSK